MTTITAKNSHIDTLSFGIKLLFLLSIFTSFTFGNQIKNQIESFINDKQQILIKERERNTFVKNADLDYLTKPFDKDVYYHRHTMSQEGQKVFDVMMADLLKFDGANLDKEGLGFKLEKHQYVSVYNGQTITNGKMTWDLKELGLSIKENEAKELNDILGFDDPRLFHVRFGPYGQGGTEVTKDENGNITKVSVYIQGQFLDSGRYTKDLVAVEKSMSTILSTIKDDMTNIQQIRAVYDGLSDFLDYGKSDKFKEKEGTGGTKTYTDLLSLNSGIAICGGYTSAMQYILQRLGYPALYIAGQGHVWNWVKLDNQWYQIDPLRGFMRGVDATHTHHIFTTLVSGDYKYNFPTLASNSYNDAGWEQTVPSGLDQYRDVNGSSPNQIITKDIYGLQQSELNDEVMKKFDNEIKNGRLGQSAKPTDFTTLRNAVVDIGARIEIQANVYGSVVDDMNISGAIVKLGDNVKIDKSIRGAESTTGNIEDVVVLIGNNTVLNRNFNANAYTTTYDVRGARSYSGNITNVYLKTGSNNILKGNVIIAQAQSKANITNVVAEFGDRTQIGEKGAVFMGAYSQGAGDITNTAVLLGSHNTINVATNIALNDSTREAAGAIRNVYMIAENNNTFKNKLTLAEIQNKIDVVDSDAMADWTYEQIMDAMQDQTKIPTKDNISNANISNIVANFGSNNTFKDFVGARHEGTGNISNVAIGFGNDTTINGKVDIAIANSGNISNIEASFGNNAKIDGNLTGATTTSGNINNTIITLGNNADINGSVVASKTDSGDITNSLIILSGITKVTGDVIGGTANSGNSMGHKIYVHDSVNADRIIGGRIINANDNSKATNNLIYIDTEVDMPNTTLYGGLSDNGAGDVLSGNKLHFSGRKGIFRDIKNFENIEIDVSGIAQASTPTTSAGIIKATTPTTPTNTDDAIITLTGSDVTNLDKTNVSLLLDANSNVKNINIFKKASGTITAPKSASAKVLKGVSMIEEFALKMDGNNTLSASWTTTGVAQEKTQNVGTAAISESELLLAGNDAIDLIFLSKSIKSNTLETFGMIRGGNIETTSGANTNTKTVNLIAGVGKNISDNAQYGVFFEGGYGSYTSRSNTIQGISDGKGSNTYYGAGLLLSLNLSSKTYTRAPLESNRNQASRIESNQAQTQAQASTQAQALTSNIYLEASIRLGQIKTDYASDNLGIESVSRSARFDTTKLYYGGHIGLGNLFKISQKSNIDLYAKAYYGQIGQDSVTLGTGDRLSFSAVNSLIGKLGARYNYNIANNFALYGGGSYEYEVLGNIKTLNEIANISYKSLKDKRDTFAIEGGTQIQPTNSDNVILNIHAKYLMGARQGIAGSVKGSYRF